LRGLIRYWLPVIAWSAVILMTSTDTFSGHHSGAVVAFLFGRFLTPAQVEMLNIVLRKIAHLAGYGFLGGLGFRAARADERGFSMRWALAGVAVAVVVASIDEWHQTTVPSRGGSVQDVLLDAAGASIAQLILAVRNVRR
jgi:VanZ family protein